MKSKEFKEDLDKLITLGKKKGFLTYDEVNEILPSEIITSDQIDNVVMLFGEEEIELIDASEEARFRQARAREVKAQAASSGDEERDIDLTPGTIGKTDDPVRM